jgi:hypothetical protein
LTDHLLSTRVDTAATVIPNPLFNFHRKGFYADVQDASILQHDFYAVNPFHFDVQTGGYSHLGHIIMLREFEHAKFLVADATVWEDTLSTHRYPRGNTRAQSVQLYKPNLASYAQQRLDELTKDMEIAKDESGVTDDNTPWNLETSKLEEFQVYSGTKRTTEWDTINPLCHQPGSQMDVPSDIQPPPPGVVARRTLLPLPTPQPTKFCGNTSSPLLGRILGQQQQKQPQKQNRYSNNVPARPMREPSHTMHEQGPKRRKIDPDK